MKFPSNKNLQLKVRSKKAILIYLLLAILMIVLLVKREEVVSYLKQETLTIGILCLKCLASSLGRIKKVIAIVVMTT